MPFNCLIRTVPDQFGWQIFYPHRVFGYKNCGYIFPIDIILLQPPSTASLHPTLPLPPPKPKPLWKSNQIGHAGLLFIYSFVLRLFGDLLLPFMGLGQRGPHSHFESYSDDAKPVPLIYCNPSHAPASSTQTTRCRRGRCQSRYLPPVDVNIIQEG